MWQQKATINKKSMNFEQFLNIEFDFNSSLHGTLCLRVIFFKQMYFAALFNIFAVFQYFCIFWCLSQSTKMCSFRFIEGSAVDTKLPKILCKIKCDLQILIYWKFTFVGAKIQMDDFVQFYVSTALTVVKQFLKIMCTLS